VLERLQTSVAELQAEAQEARAENRELENANERLTELNAQLRQEVESLGLELQAARASTQQRWLLYGAGVLLLGIITGAIVKARPRRSAWS
jgi:predicted RNase H-like nuclease (RuvC/YqgF family)